MSNSPPDNVVEKPVESVAIIGGGIAGLTTAYYLSKKGIKVCVYEKNALVGGETSYGPAAVTMWKSISKPFDRDSIDITSAGFDDFIRYFKGIFRTLLGGKSPDRSVIMSEARETYNQFVSENPDGDTLVNGDGLLYVMDKKYFDKNKEKLKGDDSMAFYTKAEFENQEDLYDPLFDGSKYDGIIHSKEEGYVNPQRLVLFLAEKVKEMGGDIKPETTVERIIEHEDGVQVIITGAEEPKYNACVVALGAFSGKFVETSGFQDNVPEIFGVKGYSITGKMKEGTLRRGVVDARDTKFIRPFVDKNGTYCVRFGGIADPYDDKNPLKIDWDRMKEFKENDLANKLFEDNSYPDEVNTDFDHDMVIEEGKVEVWAGIRPVNNRGRMPLIRYINGSTKTIVVSGFGSNGFVMCWYAGPKVASMFKKAS